MNVDDKLKSLWKSRKAAPAPSIAELTKKAGAVKKELRSKLMLVIFALIPSTAWILWVMTYRQPKMITTWIGALLAIAAVIMYVISSAGLLRLLFQATSADAPVQEYLRHMIHVREKQRFLQRTILNIYYLLLFVGISLYMIERATQMTPLKIFLLYGGLMAFGAFNWFYHRKTTIAKQDRQVSDVIEKLQAVINDSAQP